ncbi:MAG: glycogen/starch synthase [Candidatus Micrarchaeota archaeon]|nr:glycogen/starch synthase [Candidatus Micrarchaeota archaeon]
MARPEPSALIEVSSEAGRKIGGIYTVIRSKAALLHKKFGENYLLIGFLDDRCNEDVKFEEPAGKLKEIFDELAKEGITCKYGKWLYGDNSNIICVDARQAGERIVEYLAEGRGVQHDKQANYFKYLLWKHFGIDSLMEKSWDFTENVVWGMGVGMLIERLFAAGLFDKKATVLQFHEWISGAALLYCKMKGLGLATVFTTHATVLGRTLAAAGIDVYSEAARANAPISLNVAYNNRCEGKHQLEAAAAKECTVFTTVSETVAEEVKYILGRRADVITVNGIEFGNSKEGRRAHDLSRYARGELQQFMEACFISYYQMRYDNALFVYISGRYEFTNKGFDIFINALGRLNARLKKQKDQERKIFAFIFAPSSVRGPKISVIKNYLLLDKINEILKELPETKDKPYVNMQTAISLLKGEVRVDLENMAKGFIKDGDRPHINCYDLSYQNDAIINACVAAGLNNEKSNVVKVIFYPTYMKPNDGLMNLNYYDVIAAMDVGVFPSRYEPFGYTPVEAAVKMDIAITSDMTGFGRFIMKKIKKKNCGIKVIKMAGRTSDQAAEELSRELERIYRLPPKKLEKEKESAYKMMKHIEWKKVIANYYRAYSMAIEKSLKVEK